VRARALYGSGLRFSRMFAANWPTMYLSMPVIVKLVLASTWRGARAWARQRLRARAWRSRQP
jgi:hypothetical protein